MKTMLAVVLLVAGCRAQPPATYAIEKSRSYAADFDATWNAVIQFEADKNWPIKTIEKASGLVAFEAMRTDESQCDCGRGVGLYRNVEKMEAHVTLFVRRDSTTQTTVTANVSMMGMWDTTSIVDNGHSTYHWADCASTGAIERMILDGIAAKLVPLGSSSTR